MSPILNITYSPAVACDVFYGSKSEFYEQVCSYYPVIIIIIIVIMLTQCLFKHLYERALGLHMETHFEDLTAFLDLLTKPV